MKRRHLFSWLILGLILMAALWFGRLALVARNAKRVPPRREVQVKLIEGLTVADELKQLQDAFGIERNVAAGWTGQSQGRQPFEAVLRLSFPFLRQLPPTRSLEGYLFPETYRVWADQLPEALIRKQLAEFDRRFGGWQASPSSAPLKSLDEVVILASIVEQEVQTPEDRKRVAGIFLQRLKDGMRLQSDATLRYITGSRQARASNSELGLDSPYNSYRHDGLPPSPICNPSASSIQAVLQPTPSRDRYFLTDAHGNVLYAATFAQHEANRRRAGY